MFYDVYVELCQKTGEKPYAVAALVGAKSNSSVAQWKKGSIPRRPVLQSIADHFGVSIDYLLTGKKSPGAEAPELSEDEALIIQVFRSLPEAHRQALLAQVRALIPFQQDSGSPE